MRKYYLAIGFFVLTACSLSPSFPTPTRGPAAEELISELTGEEKNVLKTHLLPYAYKLNRPQFVYHWFEASSATDKWAEHFSADTPDGFELIVRKASIYWSQQHKLNSWSNLGSGLYAASDPAASQTFGGSRWVLVQIELPVGFRYLRLRRNNEEIPFPEQVSNIFNRLGCVSSNGGEINTLSSLISPKPDASIACRKVIQEFFTNELKLDGIAYEFDASYFRECAYAEKEILPADRETALIVLSSKTLRSEMVKVFNSRSTSHLLERTRIQSMFYKIADDSWVHLRQIAAGWLMTYALHSANYPEYAGMRPSSASTSVIPESGDIKVTVVLCSSAQVRGQTPICQEIEAPRPMRNNYPTLMTSLGPPIPGPKSRLSSKVNALLWPDLEGKSTSADLGEWLKASLFACGRQAGDKLSSFTEN